MDLHEETLFFVKEERRFTGLVIENLQKISDTRLFLKMGYASLFEYCTKALGYSDASAYRRISAVRVLRELPEIKEKLDSGALSLTNLSMAQSLISSASGVKKREVLLKIENCTKREAQEILAEHFPNRRASKESLRFTSGEEASLHVNLSKDTVKKLDQIKQLRSHKNPSMNYSELIEDMCEYVLKKLQPKINDKPIKRPRNPRYISAQLKQRIFKRDHHQCTYTNSQTKHRCESKNLLQIDHIIPVSKGGQSTEDNLRLLCQQHHKYVDQHVH